MKVKIRKSELKVKIRESEYKVKIKDKEKRPVGQILGHGWMKFKCQESGPRSYLPPLFWR